MQLLQSLLKNLQPSQSLQKNNNKIGDHKFFVMNGLFPTICIVYLLLLSMLPGCGLKDKNNMSNHKTFVVRVKDDYLYESDLQSLYDNTNFIAHNSDTKVQSMIQYVEEWAFKKLLLIEANNLDCLSDLDKQIKQYKNDLLAYHVLERLVAAQLNQQVSLEAIADYYKTHQDDLILNHALVKGLFLAVPKSARNINMLKSLMLSHNPADANRLKECCKAYAETAILDPNDWLPWESVLAKIRFFSEHAMRLLQTNRFIHVSDAKYVYLLKIDQYKLAKQVAPLESVQERIKAIILHKRRLSLEKQIKDKFLQNAKTKKIYVNHLAER